MVAKLGLAGGGDAAGNDALWARVKADYDTGEHTQLELCARHGVTPSQLKYRIKHHLWTPRYRSKAVDRPLIIARLFRVLELQVKNLETEMNEMADGAKRSGEGEVAVLGKLAANLERLMDLDARLPEKRRGKQQTRHMQDIRNKLVQRIEQLKRS